MLVQTCNSTQTDHEEPNTDLSGDCVFPAVCLAVAVFVLMPASSSIGAEVVQPIQQPLGPPLRARDEAA